MIKKQLIIGLLLIFTIINIFSSDKIEAPAKLKKKAVEFYKKGNYKESIKFYLKTLNTYPDDEVMLLYLAYSYEHINNLARAEKRYLDILRLNRDNRYARTSLTYLYKRQINNKINREEYNSAFDYIKKAQYYLPEDSEFHTFDAQLNFEMANYEEAYNCWYKSWKLDNKNRKDYVALWKIDRMGDAALHLGSEQLQKWLKTVLELQAKAPENRELLVLAADAYFYNNEEPVLRNRLRNKAMELYLEEVAHRPNVYVDFPLKGNWQTTSSYFQFGLDTHNGYHGYCIDWVKVDENGKRLRRGNGSQNGDYLSHGEPIYSVYDGVVVKTTDKVRDNKIGELNYISTNLIKIRHESRGRTFYSLYVHLLKGSSTVKAGDKVKKGQKIAEIGNSGLSYAPHLHFGLYDENDISMPIGFTNINYKVKGVQNKKAQHLFKNLNKNTLFINN